MFVRVKVFPNSKKEEVIKKLKDSFLIKVKEKPSKGWANRAARRALAYYFKIPESSVRLISGFKQRNKIFEIKD
jgi:hypothetical protein